MNCPICHYSTGHDPSMICARRTDRDDAMSRVAEHAPDGWLEQAHAVVRAVARRKRRFTSDDVWSAGLRKPRNARALGPVLAKLARDGVIEPTGEFVTTVQASRNAAPIRVWRSNVCAGAEAN